MHQAMILGIGSGDPKNTAIGIMWLGIIMAYNVWFVIWLIKKALVWLNAPEEKPNR